VIGIVCYRILGDGLWVFVASAVLTMTFMIVTRTIKQSKLAGTVVGPVRSIRDAVCIGMSIMAGKDNGAWPSGRRSSGCGD
jgi:hypothetical protein